MKIQQLMDKAEYGQYQILNLLNSRNTPMTMKELIMSTDLSKATLLKYIESINELMKENDLMCTINISLEEVSLYLGDYISWNEIVAVFLKNSPKYQILIYVLKKHEFSIPELAQYLLISEATLNRHISALNKVLSEFKISVSQGRLSGEELDIRHLYFELFWQVYTKDDLESHLKNYELEKSVGLIETLINKELSLEQKYKLMLWLSISYQRTRVSRKSFKLIAEKMSKYKENVFFRRLENSSLEYLRSCSLDDKKNEIMSLFAFITSHFILPVQTMEYILGFGGPVSEKITQAIKLKRKSGLVSEIANEKVIYVLGQLFCQAYFFTGSLILYSENDDLLKEITKEHDILIEELLTLLFSESKSYSIRKKSEIELRKLMIFAKENRQKTLKVAVDIDSNSLDQDLWIRLIKAELNNNKMIELFSIEEKEYYDCIISNFVHNDYGMIPVYRIKQGLTSRDLTSIALFLEERLVKKNKE